MFNFWTVMYLIVVGIVTGFAARLLVPGRDAIGRPPARGCHLLDHRRRAALARLARDRSATFVVVMKTRRN